MLMEEKITVPELVFDRLFRGKIRKISLFSLSNKVAENTLVRINGVSYRVSSIYRVDVSSQGINSILSECGLDYSPSKKMFYAYPEQKFIFSSGVVSMISLYRFDKIQFNLTQSITVLEVE